MKLTSLLLCTAACVSHSSISASPLAQVASTQTTELQSDASQQLRQADTLVHCMRTLVENRKKYNDINGIYVDGDKTTWLKVINARSQGVNTIYNVNKDLLDTIKRIINESKFHDLAQFNNICTLNAPDGPLKDNAHAQLLRELYDMNFNRVEDYSDPFLNKVLLELFLGDMEATMPQSELTMQAYVVAFKTYLEIGRAGYTDYYRKAFDYCEKLAEFKDRMGEFSSPIVDAYVIDAHRRLLNVDFINAGTLSLDDMLNVWHRVNKMLPYFDGFNHDEVTLEALTKCRGAIDKFYLKLLNRMDMNHPESLTRKYPALFKEKANYWILRLDKKHKAETTQFYHVYCFLQVMVGDWTPQEGLEKINAFYSGRFDYENITLENIDDYMEALNHAISITSMCELDEKTYNMYMHRYANTAFQVLKKCKHEVYSYKTDALVNAFLFNPALMKYMSNAERLEIMNNIRLSTQLQAYAQTRIVSRYASLILETVINEKPELLVGSTSTMKSARDVRKHKSQLMSLMDRAGKTYDIGKTLMMEIVKDDFRPLYVEEFDRLKQHPEEGIRFLELLPGSEDLHDFVLGHHKWYNGKGGYPNDAKMAKSKVKTLVEILQLADCLDGATNKMGRNYAQKKPFETVIEELQRAAGVAYNPTLVDLIANNATLNAALKNAVEKYWIEVYNDEYCNFFNKMDNKGLKDKEVDRW